MGSSKKHKEKDREREHKKKRKRSRSRSRDRERKQRSREERKRSRREKSSSPNNLERDRGEYVESRPHGSAAESLPLKEERTESPPGGGGGGESLELSIDETNRLRAKLGLKPLEVGPTPVKEEGEEDEKTVLKDDVHVPAKNLAAEKKTLDLRAKMALIREKRLINKKLGKVKTLGDAESEDEDNALGWVKKSRKVQVEKEAAAKRAKLLQEMDEEFGIGELVDEEFGTKKSQTYTSKDLRGLKVEHGQTSFKEGRTVILTLKDKGVLDEDPLDILENVNMIDDEKHAKNVENKKKKPDYVAYDDGEYDDNGVFKPKEILDKYDEEIHGEKKKWFSLASGGKYDASEDRRMEEIQEELIRQQESLLLPAPILASEYYTTTEVVGFRKTKRKAKKIRKKPKMVKAEDLISIKEEPNADFGSRSRGGVEGVIDTDIPLEMIERKADIPGLDLQQGEDMEVDDEDFLDDTEILGPEEDLTGVVVDDEAGRELDSFLHRARKAKQKRPPNAAEKIVNQRIQEENLAGKEGDGKGDVISLNATSEFCRTLGDIPTYGQAGNREEEEEDELVEWERELQEKSQQEAGDQDMDEDGGTGWNPVEIDTRPVDIAEDETPVLDDEPVIDEGIGAALSLANQKGYLESLVKKSVSAPKHEHIMAKNYSIEDKRFDDLDDKYRKRDRYAGGGITMDFKERDEYKPDVKLDYVDENGRNMSQKEAFRYLSHRFHGKGSGKKKTEKRQKKVEEEQLMKNMSSTDTPLGTVTLLQEKQKAEKTPYIVLSGAGKNLAGGANLTK